MEEIVSTDNKRYLPEDVLFKQVLSKLPVRSLCRFKCVSKSWLARISGDRSFISDHLDHHRNSVEHNIIVRSQIGVDRDKLFLLGNNCANPVEISYKKQAPDKSSSPRTFKVVGCCNGLVCLRQPASLVICNPATREFRHLPLPIANLYSMPNGGICYEVRMDLGLDKESNDYKIVRIEEIITNDQEIFLAVQFLSKTRGSWRKLQLIEGYEVRGSSKGLQIDGALHWPILPYHEHLPAKGSSFRILSFDLRSEELRVMEGPVSTVSGSKYYNLLLTQRKRSLGALMFTRQTECEFWLRTKNEKNDFCWTKMFDIRDLFTPHWRLISNVGDKFICSSQSETSAVFLYDPITDQRTGFGEVIGMVAEGVDYFQSLVPPN